ncbi:MAG: cation:proton antiporter [Firmicutes bacterium]|nr:cation:proton antiporter [Bacillota bacterium]
MADSIANLTASFVIISAAVLLARKFRFSALPLLILLGILCGPHAPHGSWFDLRLVKPTESMALLSRLGVLLLLFYLGLEFSASRVIRGGITLAKGGSIYVSLNFLRGIALGWLFFYSWPETLVVAGITTISSSAIVTKLLVDLKRTANPETELILGILVFEDAFIAVYLSLLSGYLLATQTSLLIGLSGSLITVAFILGLLFLGRRMGPHLDRWLNIRSGEPFIVVTFTLLLVMSYLAEKIHVAEAVGALLMGLVLAETSHAKRLIQMVIPMRDLFGSVFFFTFGMSIDYRTLAPAFWLALIAVLATVAGNLAAGWASARVCGYRGQAAATVACTIIARGEFAVLVSKIAADSGVSWILQPFAALYILILALLSPGLAKNSRWIYETLLRALKNKARMGERAVAK